MRLYNDEGTVRAAAQAARDLALSAGAHFMWPMHMRLLRRR